MAELLFEIGTEELPASAVYDAISQLERLAEEVFTREYLSYEEIRVFGTPRRLVVRATGLSAETGAKVIERKGPPLSAAKDEDGNWTRAASGFARGQGVEPDDLIIRDTDKGEYLFVQVTEERRPVLELLPGMLTEMLDSLRFKKSMRWGSGEERFSRPVRWLLAILDGDLIDLQFGDLRSSNSSFGHRYLSTGEVLIGDPRDYERVLEEAHVIVDQRSRRERIIRQAKAACDNLMAVPVMNEEVLDEVVMLVETPGVIIGNFDKRFLRVPGEVLIHAMQSHQRYFPVEDTEGNLTACFIAVHNGDPSHEETIRNGHERVLAARLADAEFFFDEDLKRPLAERVGDLEHVVYQAELGSMAKKSERLAELVARFSAEIGTDKDTSDRAQRAAMLSKCDLVTNMVNEFPDLQGTIGAKYAALGGEEEAVASAIAELYMPRRLGDSLPGSTEGALLSLAEKADNLASSFGLGHVPTGSEDPYALRRQSLGMILILMDRGYHLSIDRMVGESAALLEAEAQGFSWSEAAQDALADFVIAREKVYFSEAGNRYDIVDAVLAVDWDLPLSARMRMEALQNSRESGLLSRLYTAFERCHNLARGQTAGPVDIKLFEEDVEHDLWDAVQSSSDELISSLEGMDYMKAAVVLEQLCSPVDQLFDDVMIMVEDEAVRNNRLTLLAHVDALFGKLADFSKLSWD